MVGGVAIQPIPERCTNPSTVDLRIAFLGRESELLCAITNEAIWVPISLETLKYLQMWENVCICFPDPFLLLLANLANYVRHNFVAPASSLNHRSGYLSQILLPQKTHGSK
jgi:hypothetical protein